MKNEEGYPFGEHVGKEQGLPWKLRMKVLLTLCTNAEAKRDFLLRVHTCRILI